MKKFLFLVFAFALFIPFVNAEVDNTVYQWTAAQNNLNLDYTDAYSYISTNNLPNWAIVIPNGVNSINNFWVVVSWSNNTTLSYIQDINDSVYGAYSDNMDITIYFSNDNTTDTTNGFNLIGSGYYLLYDSNFDFISQYNYELSGFYSDDIIINIGDTIPLYKDLVNYSNFSDYEQNHLSGYTEVNLNNYEYVLLTLKDYSRSTAFDSTLYVNGQVGITPIYNYGQTSKDSVTGVQVQDRCNAFYSSYTAYPLYILQQDLLNNVVYAVKSCSENSSFKFDNYVFNISYVTESNSSDPTVNIGGTTYHVIPYSDLPSTATENEDNNYIPGESYNFVDSGIDSLNSALKNSSNWLASVWSTFTYFTSFVGQLFSSLPIELHAILISAFTLTIIIGLIKHFTG